MKKMISILLGFVFISSTAYAIDINALETLASKGNSGARFLLADAYESGYGVPESTEQALALYQQAADKGDVWAMMQMGRVYQYGLYGMPQNTRSAFIWYEKAAKKGYALAQRRLGTFYFKGIGVSQSDKLAYVWWSLAAAGGDKLAAQYVQAMGKAILGVDQRKANEMILLYKRQYGYDKE